MPIAKLRLLLILLLSTSQLYAQFSGQRQFTTKDGLPSNEVYHTIKVSNGYVYHFTEFGIVKNTGHGMQPVALNIHDSMRTAYATCVTEQGQIYFVNSKHVFYELRNDSAFQVADLRKNEPANERGIDINRLELTAQQFIAHSGYRTYLINRSNYKVEQYKSLTSNDDLIIRLVPNPFHILITPSININRVAYKGHFLLELAQGDAFKQIKIYSKSMLMRHNYLKYREGYLMSNYNDLIILSDAGIQKQVSLPYRIIEIHEFKGFYLVCTLSGLYVLTNDLQVINVFLPNLLITGLCIDKDDIWINTGDEGVYLWENASSLDLYLPNVLQNEVVTGISMIGHKLYFGMGNGNILYQKSEGFETMNASTYKAPYFATLQFKNRNYHFLREHLISTDTSNSSNSMQHKSVNNYKYFQQIGDEIFGAEYFYVHNTSKMLSDKGIGWLSGFNVSCLGAFQNQLLVGTRKGLIQASLSDTGKRVYPNLFSGKYITALASDQKNLWVGTQSNELYKVYDFERRYFKTIHTPDFRLLKHLILFENKIIVATNIGTYIADTIIVKNQLKWHKIASGEPNTIKVNGDRLYLAYSDGLKVFNLSSPKVPPLSPIYLSRIFADSLDLTDNVDAIPHHFNQLKIEFDYLDYLNDTRQFFYRLSGEVKTSGKITGHVLNLNNLSPGEYTLQIIALKDDVKHSLPLVFTFKIIPAFWQTWWFKFLFAVICFNLLFFTIWYYFKRRKRQEVQTIQLNRKIAEYQIVALKAQINPHFISNALASIQALVNNQDIDSANLYISRFSFLIRMVLFYSDKRSVRLKDEIDLLKIYIDLEQLRFQERFHFNIKIDQLIDTDELYIPNLIMQPIVENAIWHGLLQLKEKRHGLLELEILETEVALILGIRDNGVGRHYQSQTQDIPSSKHISKGTQLVQERILTLNQLLETKVKASFEITDLFNENNEPTGTLVRITLPFEILTALKQNG
jgi:hypothetical protein